MNEALETQAAEKPQNPRAFPLSHPEYEAVLGMTLLDYFAGKSLIGLIEASGRSDYAMYLDGSHHDSGKYQATLAAISYDIAEAMLAERAKRGLE